MNTTRKRNAFYLAVLLVMLAAAAYVWSPALQRRWIEARSTDDLRRMVESKQSDGLIDFVYADRLAKMGKAEEAWPVAKRAADTVTEGTPPDIAAKSRALAGCLAAEAGDTSDAERYLGLAGSVTDAQALVEFGRGILAASDGRKAESIRHISASVKLDAGLPQAWTRLGEVYLEVSQPGDALAAFEKANALRPNDPRSHAAVAEALGRLRRYSEATREAQAAASLAPDDVQFAALPAISLASSARTEEEYSDAVTTMESASKQFPGSEFLRLLLGGLHMRFNRFGPARVEFEKYLALHPDDGPILLNLSDVCERLGDEAASKRVRARFVALSDVRLRLVELRKLALYKPTDPEVFLGLYRALLQAGKRDEAFRALSRAAQLRPGDPQIARLMANAGTGLGPADGGPLNRRQGLAQ